MTLIRFNTANENFKAYRLSARPFRFTESSTLSYNEPKLTSDWIGSTGAKSPTSAFPEFDLQ